MTYELIGTLPKKLRFIDSLLKKHPVPGTSLTETESNWCTECGHGYFGSLHACAAEDQPERNISNYFKNIDPITAINEPHNGYEDKE
jgi:hypothetical protein